MIPTEEAPNPLDAFETVGGILAFIYHKGGESDLRKLLSMFREGDFNREFVQRAADELKAVGLSKAAAIVAEFAATLPSECDMRFCAYPQTPENEYNIRAWLQSKQRKLRQRPTSGPRCS